MHLRHLPTFMAALLAASVLFAGGSSAMDLEVYRARVADFTNLQHSTPETADVLISQLDDLAALGALRARDYAATHPSHARLMIRLAEAVPEMRRMTRNELEDQWGETGWAGDALGTPLKALGQWEEQRNTIELVVAPTMASILIRKWKSSPRAHWLQDAQEEMVELQQHLARLR